MVKIEPVKVGKGQLMEQLTKVLFNEISETNLKLDISTTDEMLRDVDISKLVNKINRTVGARELVLWSDKPELLGKAKEIQARFNIVKFNRVFKLMLNARYYGYSLFEKVYNDEYCLTSLVHIPQKFVVYDNKDGWYINASNKKIPIDRDKYLLCIHERDVANKQGKSVFVDILQAYTDKKMYSGFMRNLAKKYGEVIIFFAYDSSENEEDIKKKAEEVKKMQGGGTVIGVPTSMGVSLSDSIYLLDLKDIDPSIYTKLHDWEAEKIVQNLLGGTLTINNGQGRGSYGLGEIHQEAFEEVVNDCCNFITDKLQELLYYDGLFFGYDHKDFYFKLEKVKNRDEEMAYLHKQEELKALKITNIKAMQESNIKDTDLNGGGDVG